MIKLNHVYKSFGDLILFEDLHLEIQKTGIYIIEGASGSGKSTLFHILMGYEKVEKGTVLVKETPVYIFQNYELLDSLTVEENILMGCKKEEMDMEMVRYFEMESFLHAYPRELSGGQRQRVGILRSLMRGSSIILCDEPTEALDVANKDLVMHLLKKMSDDHIILVVTHDQHVLTNYGDVFYAIEDHRLKCKEIKKEGKECLKNRKRHSDGIKESANILWQIRKYSMILFPLLLFLVTFLFGVLYSVQDRWFSLPETRDVVNANYVYIKGKEEGKSSLLKRLDDIDGMDGAYREIVDVRFFYYDGSKYRGNLYPYPQEERFDGVYLNQNAREVLKGVEVGSNLELIYRLKGREYSIDVPVKGFVEERDIDSIGMYYDLEYLLECFEKETNVEKEEVMNRRQYFERYGDFLEYEVSYDVIGDVMKELEASGIEAFSPLFDQRMRFEKENAPFHLFYLGLLGLYLLMVVMMVLFYLHHQRKKMLRNYAILLSQSFPFKKIKVVETAYLLMEVSFFLVLSGCGTFLFAYTGLFTVKAILYTLGVMAVLALLWLLCEVWGWRKIRVDRFGSILKEGL